MLSYRVGIWSRLLLAFSFIAGITVLVGIVSLLIFNGSGRVVEDLAKKHIPEIIQTTGLVKIGGEIVAMAPNILSTEDDENRGEVKKELDKILGKLKDQVENLPIAGPEERKSVEQLVIRLETNLTALQFSVEERSELQQRLNRMTERLRWLYADLIDEVDPLKQDYTYNLESEIERIVDAAREQKSVISYQELQKNRESKESVEKIRSNGVLLVSLMVQGATLDARSQIENLLALSSDAIALLKQDMQNLKNDVSSLTLQHVLKEMYPLAEGESSIFAVRAKIIDSEISGRELLKNNQLYVEDLDKVIDEIVTRVETESGAATASTRKSLKRGKTTLLVMVLVSLVTVAAVMWFYVRGSIVARLSALSASMRAIARGDLSYKVPEGGPDEIGRMAVALKVFRDTAQAVEDANSQAIIDNAAVGLVLADPDGSIRFFNPEAEKLFRADSAAMAGASIFEIASPPDRDVFIQQCKQVLDGKELSHTSETLTGRRLDSSEFPMDVCIRKVHQRNKTRLMVTVHDVTEREQAHELLRKRVREKTDHLSQINIKLREEVQERHRIENELVQAGKLAALGQFSAGIAHELNQPLSAIRYYLHNAGKLLERGQTDVHRKNLTKMEELIERMAKMIKHLKTFARHQPNRLSAVNILDTIGRALELLSDRIEQGGVSVATSFSGEELTAYADSARLEQVLVNVLSNGIDAVSGSRNGAGQLTITAEDNDSRIVIKVCDNGPGIEGDPPEIVFDPFYTTKEVGQGLGLGLSIAYNMVKGFGGRMTAANLQTGGACFTIILQRTQGNN